MKRLSSYLGVGIGSIFLVILLGWLVKSELSTPHSSHKSIVEEPSKNLPPAGEPHKASARIQVPATPAPNSPRPLILAQIPWKRDPGSPEVSSALAPSLPWNRSLAGPPADPHGVAVQADAPALPWVRKLSDPSPVEATAAVLLWRANLDHPASVDVAAARLPWSRHWASHAPAAVETASLPWTLAFGR